MSDLLDLPLSVQDNSRLDFESAFMLPRVQKRLGKQEGFFTSGRIAQHPAGQVDILP